MLPMAGSSWSRNKCALLIVALVREFPTILVSMYSQTTAAHVLAALILAATCPRFRSSHFRSPTPNFQRHRVIREDFAVKVPRYSTLWQSFSCCCNALISASVSAIWDTGIVEFGASGTYSAYDAAEAAGFGEHTRMLPDVSEHFSQIFIDFSTVRDVDERKMVPRRGLAQSQHKTADFRVLEAALLPALCLLFVPYASG